MVVNVLNLFMELDLNILMIYSIKETIDSYNALFALATNTPVLLMTAYDSRVTH